MERSEQKSGTAAGSRSLSDAVRSARIRLAEDIDGIADRRISDLTRLDMLKGELEGIFEQVPKTDERFELVLVPSTPVRLWIDMFTYVTREPVNGHYCLIRNGREGPRALAESQSASAIADRVIDYVAGELVKRERQLQGYAELERRLTPPPPAPEPRRRPAVGIIVWAFVVGMLTGMVALLAFHDLTEMVGMFQ